MKNDLLTLSPANRPKPLPLSGAKFLNEVVLISQALEAAEGDLHLDDVATTRWKAALNFLLFALFYAQDLEKFKEHEPWTKHRASIKALADSADEVVSQSASLMKACFLLVPPKNSKSVFPPAQLKVAKAEMTEYWKKVAERTAFMAKVVPTGVSTADWTTFVRNLPRVYAETNFPNLRWDRLPAQNPSKEGKAGLARIYDNLFTSHRVTEVWATSEGNFDFGSVVMSPRDNPTIMATIKRIKDTDLQFKSIEALSPKSFVIRTSDAGSSYAEIEKFALKPLIDEAQELDAKAIDAHAKNRAEKVKGITVSRAMAEKLLDALTQSEYESLLALLAKATASPKNARKTKA